MKVNPCVLANKPVAYRQSFASSDLSNRFLVIYEIPGDTFEKQEYDSTVLPGPYGHPYSGRPIVNSGNTEVKESFIEWLLSPEKKYHPRPKLLIERIFSLGDNNFDDEVTRYHQEIAKEALQTAKSIAGKGKPIDIPIGDLTGDGKVDRIVSGINRAIDLTGDGKADIIGTLIDTTGDGKGDMIRDVFGNLIELNGKTAEVLGDSSFTMEDLKLIPDIIKAVLGI